MDSNDTNLNTSRTQHQELISQPHTPVPLHLLQNPPGSHDTEYSVGPTDILKAMAKINICTSVGNKL